MVDYKEKDGIRAITIRNDHLSEKIKKESGESNGYIVISDKNHPWYGKLYGKIDVPWEVCYRELTYSKLMTKGEVESFENNHMMTNGLTGNDIGSWMIGFDTVCVGYDERSSLSNVKVFEIAVKLRDHAVSEGIRFSKMTPEERKAEELWEKIKRELYLDDEDMQVLAVKFKK